MWCPVLASYLLPVTVLNGGVDTWWAGPGGADDVVPLIGLAAGNREAWLEVGLADSK